MLWFDWFKNLRIPMSSTLARLGIGRKRKKLANCNDFNAKEIGRWCQSLKTCRMVILAKGNVSTLKWRTLAKGNKVANGNCCQLLRAPKVYILTEDIYRSFWYQISTWKPNVKNLKHALSTLFYKSVRCSWKFSHYSVRNKLLRTNLLIFNRNYWKISKFKVFVVFR